MIKCIKSVVREEDNIDDILKCIIFLTKKLSIRRHSMTIKMIEKVP